MSAFWRELETELLLVADEDVESCDDISEFEVLVTEEETCEWFWTIVELLGVKDLRLGLGDIGGLRESFSLPLRACRVLVEKLKSPESLGKKIELLRYRKETISKNILLII